VSRGLGFALGSGMDNKTKKRIENILLNLDIQKDSWLFEDELENALAAREIMGLTFKQIEALIEERTEGKRLWA
jgi:hypothetical protein